MKPNLLEEEEVLKMMRLMMGRMIRSVLMTVEPPYNMKRNLLVTMRE